MRFSSMTSTVAIIAPATTTGKSRPAIDATSSQPRPDQAKIGSTTIALYTKAPNCSPTMVIIGMPRSSGHVGRSPVPRGRL
jgi:hypothetical protein